MAVVNKIGKVMKRNHALVTFDQERIVRAIRRAADSIGGFTRDYVEGINDLVLATAPGTETVCFLRSLSIISSRTAHLLGKIVQEGC